MVINEPRCDYLRVTTYSKGQYEKMAEMIKDMAPDEDAEPGNFLQYQGDWYSHGFHGVGEQGGYAHWLAQASGEVSQIALDWFLEATAADSTRCTRLDLQVTIPMPNDWDIRQHVDLLRERSWPNRRRKVEFYENEGPGGTIYIGSRQSAKFARLYVKFSGSDEWPFCLRYEIELKGEVADLAWKTLHVEAANPMQILRAEFERMPILETATWHRLGQAIPHGGMPILVPKNLPDENKTIRWLIHKVTPTIKRMLNSHEHGYRTYSWLTEMANDYKKGES